MGKKKAHGVVDKRRINLHTFLLTDYEDLTSQAVWLNLPNLSRGLMLRSLLPYMIDLIRSLGAALYFPILFAALSRTCMNNAPREVGLDIDRGTPANNFFDIGLKITRY